MAERMELPRQGEPRDAVMAALRAMKAGDADWQGGRVPLYVFKASDAVTEIGRDAFVEYFSENALGSRRAFPSVKRMEEEVVDMALGLFHAPAGAQGFMTTGGTESIVHAVQAARDFAREARGERGHRGNIVGAETLHPAFNKAAKLMDLEVRRAPVGAGLRMDLDAVAALVDGDTIMLVGSAPNFPYGMIDPIGGLAEIARRHGVWLHVDACVGGYLAPFAAMIGRAVPAFDFAVPEVVSLSADLHKFGFCPKPASTVFYRDEVRARGQMFDADVWPNGRFATSTIVGTRPGGGVAGAWATLRFLGVEGYCRIARELMESVDRYRAGLAGIDGISVLGDPDLSIVAYGSDSFDIFLVAEAMAAKGWLPGLVQRPKGIHRMMSLLHAPAMEAYLDDVRAAVGVVRQGGRAASGLQATY